MFALVCRILTRGVAGASRFYVSPKVAATQSTRTDGNEKREGSYFRSYVASPYGTPTEFDIRESPFR